MQVSNARPDLAVILKEAVSPHSNHAQIGVFVAGKSHLLHDPVALALSDMHACILHGKGSTVLFGFTLYF